MIVVFLLDLLIALLTFVLQSSQQDKVEFGEGELGVSCGIKVVEPSLGKFNKSRHDWKFRRTISADVQWPEEPRG